MYACLSTAKLSVLANGSLTLEFQVTRRIHQGDSLSPVLFNIAVEGLAVLSHYTSETGLFIRLKLQCGEYFTHL
jgi:hypothetical protein